MRGLSEKARQLREELIDARQVQGEVLASFKARAAKNPKATMTPQERSDFDKADDTITVLRAELDAEENSDRGQYAGMRGGASGRRSDPDVKAFDKYLRSGSTSDLIEARTSSGLTTSPTEAGQTDTSDAGYMVPMSFWDNLQIALKAYGGAANDFKQVNTPREGRPMPWPTLDPTATVASLMGAELTQLSIASPYVFGEGILNAWTIVTNPILASIQLAQDSAFDLTDFVRDRVAEQIGRKLAALAISGAGTGSGQPLGLITALNAKGATSGGNGGYYGLTAATTVKTFAGTPTELASNTLSPQTLIAMMQAVDPAYYGTQNGARWYLNANQAWNLRTVVDSNGRPLINFANGFDADSMRSADYSSNAPVAELFGFGVVIDNSIPNLTASTTGGPVFGSLAHAMVKRNGPASILVLRERYADYLAIGYIGFSRLDSQGNDLRAAVTVKPAAT